MTEDTLFWVTLAVLAVLGYAAACAIWPWGACRRCKGKKALMSPSGRYHRDCPSCGGKGRKPRMGRRALDVARR